MIADLSREKFTLQRSQNSVLLYGCSCLSAINEASLLKTTVAVDPNPPVDEKTNGEKEPNSQFTDFNLLKVLVCTSIRYTYAHLCFFHEVSSLHLYVRIPASASFDTSSYAFRFVYAHFCSSKQLAAIVNDINIGTHKNWLQVSEFMYTNIHNVHGGVQSESVYALHVCVYTCTCTILSVWYTGARV